MSPEGYIRCSDCNKFEIEKANLPEFPAGKSEYKYPKDKEIDQKVAEQLMDHHYQTGAKEIHGHSHFDVIINGEENTHIIASCCTVEYYISGSTKP